MVLLKPPTPVEFWRGRKRMNGNLSDGSGHWVLHRGRERTSLLGGGEVDEGSAGIVSRSRLDCLFV